MERFRWFRQADSESATLPDFVLACESPVSLTAVAGHDSGRFARCLLQLAVTRAALRWKTDRPSMLPDSGS